MLPTLPTFLPDAHRQFLSAAAAKLARDPRLAGLAAAGSFVTGSMDEFSDLDLLVAVEDADYAEVLRTRGELAATLGPLLAAFTGEHVGEPRLLICLYAGTPPLHVDLKFVTLGELGGRVEDPVVLWERDGRLSRSLAQGQARYPEPDPQWLEDRFWVWVHYATCKLGRGELFEVLGFLSFLRSDVLGPLALKLSGARPSGVRRLEHSAPKWSKKLETTVATYDRASCGLALQACVDLYRQLREQVTPAQRHLAAEQAALSYLSTTILRQPHEPA